MKFAIFQSTLIVAFFETNLNWLQACTKSIKPLLRTHNIRVLRILKSYIKQNSDNLAKYYEVKYKVQDSGLNFRGEIIIYCWSLEMRPNDNENISQIFFHG